jgi:hypothetical protein
MTRYVLASAFAGASVLAFAGCGSDDRDLFAVPFDAGSDSSSEEDGEAGGELDPTLGGPCTEDAQCDDDVPCTFDRCDQDLWRCRNTPDDAQCDDGVYCNGREVCAPRRGCAPGPVVTCQDGNPCTIDRCVEAAKSCERSMRDVDGDGDPDDHCVGSRDCNDIDPTVSSLRAEICGNFKDDNCNGQIDEQPCSVAEGDVCATALAVSAPGTYLLTSVAAQKDYATTCTVKSPAAAQDIVVAITVPDGGGARDVQVWTTAALASNEVAIALQATCGNAATEIGCGHVDGTSSARTIARGVAPGETVHAIVTTQSESPVDLKVEMPPATSKPTNESCAAPEPVALETPFTVSLIDAAKDLTTGCDKAKTGELTYAFTLSEPRDVRVFASTLAGPGDPVVTLRDATCTGELRCRSGTTPPLFARSLPAGTHVIGVAGTTQLDASIMVRTYAPSAPPANQSCATAPAAPRGTAFAVDLSAQEDAIATGCLPGGPAAAYALELTEPSDVLVVGRFPANRLGAVSLHGPDCTTQDRLACSTGTTPVRVSRRNLPPGSYRVVVADELGQSVQLTVLVRPTVAPVKVTASGGCASTVSIPQSGGFFTGDTSSHSGDFNAGCDAPGQPLGGAPDQMLRLDLSQSRRVVLDMSGSFYTTVLDLRTGPTCPGTEVAGACHVGFGPSRSFLETVLAAGRYWVQVDGYAGDSGPWNLDVRVLPP